MESSKATAKHIRQVAGDLPAIQIHLMHHQCTKLLTGNYNKHKKTTKQRPQNHRPEQMAKKSFDLQKLEKPSNKCIRCSDTSHAKGFQCPAKKFQCKVCHKFGHFTSVCYQKTIRHQAHLSLGNLRYTNLEQGPYTPIKMWMALYLKSQILMNHSPYR